MDTFAERLKWARERWQQRQDDGRSPTEVARDFGWTVSTYLGYENGDKDRKPRLPMLKRIARAYGVRWEWLLSNEGSPTARPLLAPVLGYVGAGGQIFPMDDFAQGEALDEVEMPQPSPNAVAVIVRGDSMYPRYFDGELIFYDDREMPPKELIGRECVVKLKNGQMLLKRLRRGSRANRFNLESWNANPLEDQDVEWAAPVKWRC